MANFPGDSDSLRIDRRACAIVHYRLDLDNWDFKLLTGQDVGYDCIIELSDNDRWTGKKIEIQIKGTRNLENYALKSDSVISFPLEIKTINYALGCTNAFLLAVVDVEKEKIYIEELHDYICDHPNLAEKLDSDQKKLSIHVPMSNELNELSEKLFEIASYVYADGRRVVPVEEEHA